MDQLVPVFEFLKKNRFWISCFLLAAAMVATWVIATGQLDTETATNLADVKKRISSYSNIMGTTADTGDAKVSAHPNKQTKTGMETEIDKATQSVLKSWKMRHDAQKAIMKWPEEIASPEFVNMFKQFDPPETFPVDRTGLQMVSFLQIYNLQIPKTMKRITQIIKTDWKYKSDESSATPAEGEENEDGAEREGQEDSPQSETNLDNENSIVVTWNEDNQDLWNQKLTTFKGRDDHKLFNTVPSPSQVYMLQQDLWLLEAFFNIIKKVNGAADANDLATIKRIDHIAFGREALTQLGKIEDPNRQLANVAQENANSTAPPTGSELEAEKNENLRNARNGTTDGDSPGAELNYTGQPAYHGRYVNENFEPILADDIRKVLTGEELPENNLELVVSKRVPVRFAGRMDERKIPEFLTACYQWGQDGDKPSPFIFEVWQVRINRHTPGDGIELRGAHSAVDNDNREKTAAEKAEELASAAGGGGGMAGLEGGEEDPNEAAGGSGLKRSEGIATRIDYDVDVEFYGIVKIYNPVNEELLTGKSSDDTNQASPDSNEDEIESSLNP